MNSTSPVLRKETTIWRAWVGFNASHSLGTIILSAIYIPLAFSRKAFLIVLSLTAQTVPSIAAVFNAETIEGVEVEIRRPDNGIYPLIIFSHGMGACPADYAGIQDRLVNAGYIVVSPKHADCISGNTTPDIPWRKSGKWTDTTNSNRRDDLHKLLDALPSSTYAQYTKTFKQVGCMGHSMGGYTCMGLAGAWDSWKRNEVISVALLSPWNKPFVLQDRMSNMTNVKTLYQGGSRDRPISPSLIESNGTFNKTKPSKYLQIFKRARHSSWTDGILAKRFHEEMSYYITSFFDMSLKSSHKENLEIKKSKVTELKFEH
jgi:dienelactone hydrolase